MSEVIVLATAACAPASQPSAPIWTTDSSPPMPSPAEWFDVAGELGRRGYKYLPTASQLLLAAGRRALLALPSGFLDATSSSDRSIWVGTSESAAAIHGPMDEVVRVDGSNLLSPLTAPYFSINLLAGRLSGEFQAHGGATTFTTPCTAGLDALAACARTLRGRSAGLGLVAAVEVPPPAGEPGSATAEAGAVALVVTAADAMAGDGVRLATRCTSWGPDTLAGDLNHLHALLADALPSDALPSDALPSDPAPARVTLLLADEAKQCLDAGALGFDPVIAAVGSGSYLPMAAVVAAVQDSAADEAPGPVRIVISAGPDGRLGGVSIHRLPDSQGSRSVPALEESS